MDKTLAIHISFLEQKLKDLHKELMDEAPSLVERNRIESEIRAADMALVYYQKAWELEKQLTSN
jgi:hypothetical protein